MNDHNEVIALPDSQKITFKEIARSVMNEEKSRKLKAKAYTLMGSVLETDERKNKQKIDKKYIQTAIKKTSLDKYLAFLGGKPSECSVLSRGVILEFWKKEKDINGPTRLNVFV